MIAWLLRGLRKGTVTTRYPARPEPAPEVLRGRITVTNDGDADPRLADLCPTGAITVHDGQINLDRGRCILCGRCTTAAPMRFAFVPTHETAASSRQALWVEATEERDDKADLPAPLIDQARALGRSIHIRHVDAGSDGGEEWEIAALTNPYYDMQRLGLYFTAAPRHADVLLVTGAVTEAMRTPLLRAWEIMPEPKVVVAVGTDACSGGLAAGSIGATGVCAVLPVDVFIPGSPPTPIAILHGLLLAVGLIREEPAA